MMLIIIIKDKIIEIIDTTIVEDGKMEWEWNIEEHGPAKEDLTLEKNETTQEYRTIKVNGKLEENWIIEEERKLIIGMEIEDWFIESIEED